VNIYEEGSDVVVKAEIPVMKKRNIHVDINDRTVTIHSDKRSCGSFASTVDLPAAVQMEKARASFKDGVLEVRVPKTGKVSRRTRKIAGE
jgi:HSP20 family protein